MPLFLIPLLSFLKNHWKLFAVTAAALGVITYVYLKGRNACVGGVEHTVIVEQTKRHNDAEKERTDTNTKIEKTRKVRKSKPIDDERDSCLLSSNPFETNCLPE